MKQLNLKQDECCNKTKRFLMDDLDKQLGLGRIYLQHKKRKLKRLEAQVGMIMDMIQKSDCDQFKGWLQHQYEEGQNKNDIPDTIVKAVETWVDCDIKFLESIKGKYETYRSKVWESTGELL